MADNNQEPVDSPPSAKPQEFAKADSLAFQMYMKQKKRKKRNEAEE